MELRHLRYFTTVAEELHFTRAAERLGLGQPPLSQQIRQLEQEIGSPLFHRRSRGVELTDVGEALLKDAREILDHMERAKATAQRVARGEEGMVRIGFTVSTSYHPLIPSVIRDYRAQYPHVVTSLEVMNSASLADAVEDGQIDAAFVRTPMSEHDGLTIQPLLAESLVIALPNGHRLATSETVALAGLRDQDFIMHPRRVATGLYDATIAACQRAGFTPHVVHEVAEFPPLLNFVAAGLGVAIVPASMQHMHLESVSYRTIEGDVPTAEISIIRRSNEGSTATRNLVALARRLARDMAGAGIAAPKAAGSA